MANSAKQVRKELRKSTSTSVGGKWFGILLAVLSMPALFFGTVISDESVLMNFLTQTLQVIGGSGVLVGGLIWWASHRKQKKLIAANRERLLWQFIRQHEGRISAGQLAAESGWSLKDSRSFLEVLCDTGEGEMLVLSGGRFQYVFEDFLPIIEGELGRSSMPNPRADDEFLRDLHQ